MTSSNNHQVRGISSLLHRVQLRIGAWVGESPSTRDYKLILFLLRKRGIRYFVARNRYDDNFYADLVASRAGNESLADLIYATFEPTSVCDFGCGNGFLLEYLLKRGITVLGVEGSENSLAFIDTVLKDRIEIRDLSQTHKIGQFELGVSLEVAEHIPKKYSRNFISNLTANASKHILFSAARPGQWGDGHINCQPRQFWIDLVQENDWSFDEHATASFTESVKSKKVIVESIPWILDNFAIFHRNHQPGAYPLATTSDPGRRTASRLASVASPRKGIENKVRVLKDFRLAGASRPCN